MLRAVSRVARHVPCSQCALSSQQTEPHVARIIPSNPYRSDAPSQMNPSDSAHIRQLLEENRALLAKLANMQREPVPTVVSTNNAVDKFFEFAVPWIWGCGVGYALGAVHCLGIFAEVLKNLI